MRIARPKNRRGATSASRLSSSWCWFLCRSVGGIAILLYSISVLFFQIEQYYYEKSSGSSTSPLSFKASATAKAKRTTTKTQDLLVSTKRSFMAPEYDDGNAAITQQQQEKNRVRINEKKWSQSSDTSPKSLDAVESDTTTTTTRTTFASKDFSKQHEQQQRPDYHIIFSTSCSKAQDWESYVFFYHAMKVQQPGRVTRIASACTPAQQDALKAFFHQHIQPMSRPPHNSFHLHFTPDYGKVRLANDGGPYSKYYQYMNKPYGVRHWMEHALGMGATSAATDIHNTTQQEQQQQQQQQQFEDGIVILMDPDMVLLRPILHDFTDVENHLWAEDNPPTRVVRHGFPMAQQDGYLSNQWMQLDLEYITNKTAKNDPSLIPIPPAKEGLLYWSSGPPYLATVRDMYKIVERWTEYTPRVLDIHPQLFAEMKGLIFATLQLGLPFTLVKSIVVSFTKPETRAPNVGKPREGWEFIDSIPAERKCNPPKSAKLPIALHYCKNYAVDEWYFSKYRIRDNILDCDKSLLMEPPPNLATLNYTYWIEPPGVGPRALEEYVVEKKKIPMQQPQDRSRREPFMVCAMTRAMNEALTYHRQHSCGVNGGNQVKNYTLWTYPWKN